MSLDEGKRIVQREAEVYIHVLLGDGVSQGYVIRVSIVVEVLYHVTVFYGMSVIEEGTRFRGIVLEEIRYKVDFIGVGVFLRFGRI